MRSLAITTTSHSILRTHRHDADNLVLQRRPEEVVDDLDREGGQGRVMAGQGKAAGRRA